MQLLGMAFLCALVVVRAFRPEPLLRLRGRPAGEGQLRMVVY